MSFTVSCEDGSALQKHINDPSYQVGVFCAGGLEDVQDIRFPEGSRIKVDGLKGTVSFGRKNKPGSVEPIDISNGLRLRPGPAHTVELTASMLPLIYNCKNKAPNGNALFATLMCLLMHWRNMEKILREAPKSQERVAIDANGKLHANVSNRWPPSAKRYNTAVVDLTLSGDDDKDL
ncbi:hypothetical protein FANTH_4021 [Fusarium anthophilum]|uniref:PINIT domain-containing protein n=1 Tax=Fusarium anthophilum TaxID=48485 RepID=A0A8H4ZRT8_9HYPO|nr:hypothetical protein FANTH_4021 [Fusarium anthophilum]